MSTFYVMDLDGTLLSSNDSISQYSIQTINELEAKGMQFTYATAHSLVSVSVGAKELLTTVLVIACNEVLIIDLATGMVASNDEDGAAGWLAAEERQKEGNIG